jgi:hypothetical protein
METATKPTAIANKALEISFELYDIVSLLKTALAAMPSDGTETYLDARETVRIATKKLSIQAERVEVIDPSDNGGYSNYETKLVLGCLLDDGAHPDLAKIFTENEGDTYKQSKALQEFVWDCHLCDFEPTGLADDFISASMREVNWHELAESLEARIDY